MCTGIQVKTKSGAPVYARTLEFGIDLQSQLLVIPKGTSFTGVGPTGDQPGMTWTAKYNMTGLNTMGLNILTDGLNSEGLAAGAFYFTGCAGYMDVTAAEAGQSVCSSDVVTYLLSTCANVAEVKEAVKTLKVNKGIAPAAAEALQTTIPVPLHYNIHDAAGNALVVEHVNGQVHIHDNPIGVLTNNPELNWHWINLSNYVALTPYTRTGIQLHNVTNTGAKGPEIYGTGQGSGFIGLPGDITSPSRFIRAVAHSQAAVPADTNELAVDQAFHILNSFDIPFGSVRQVVPATQDQPEQTICEYTLWTAASDMQQRRYYFHTFQDRRVCMLDLANWEFTSKDIIAIDMNQGRSIVELQAQYHAVPVMP
ncbi:linear amide C-N hydrolase [Taibaiella chishuiensis]|uniref:Choloylglycine hydrolase n=1 Tax=Taibaiella chishuiensis TaxID=1434707 RepID=A0A2P8CZF7_9BACT|nr:choloylglycine hydrolase family protein [Taibaiella chishuiensis]PSK90355.1 choloylglycine hydrolase [Taibaiella chishuiensis]